MADRDNLLESAPILQGVPTTSHLTMAELDDHFRQRECPLWDSPSYLCGAMRATGFVGAPNGDALVFQALTVGRLGSCVERSSWLYMPGPLAVSPGCETEVLVANSLLFTVDDDRESVLHHVTGVTTRWGDDGEQFECPLGGPRSHFQFGLKGHTFNVEVTPDELGDFLGPVEVLMVNLGRQPCAGATLLDPPALASALGLPTSATPLFQIDAWSHPGAGRPASSSSDLQLMVQALAERRQLTLGERPGARQHLRRRFAILGGWGNGTAWGRGGA